MLTRHGITAAAALAAAAMTIAGEAAAQQGGEAKGASPESGVLEEVIVQAQKRSESLQQVPIAATVLTPEALETRFVKDFTDISGALPNASLEGEGLSNYASSFYMRGQGTQNRGPFVDPAVSVIVDGIAGGYVATALTDMIDISAIEVLRGPQGTLQGRNSTGGAILVRHAAPDARAFSANFGLLAGNAGRKDVTGMLNVPLIDGTAAFRVAAKWTRTDGFFTNVYNPSNPAGAGGHSTVGGENRTTILPSLRWQSDNWDATLRGTYNRYRDDSSTLIPRYACRIDPRVNANTPRNDTYVNSIATRFGGAAALQYCAESPSSSLFTINQNRPIEGASLDQTGVTAQINYQIANAGTITLVSNYQDNEELSALDVDGTFAQLNSNQEDTKHHQFSDELRFASDFSKQFDFVAGLFYLRQHYTLVRISKVDGAPVALIPAIRTFNSGSGQGNTQDGAFAQANWHFTDRLTAVAGARYTKDKKELRICATGVAACAGRFQFNSADWQDTSPRVGLNFQYDPRTFFYAYWAKGFRAGGFNGEAGTASAAGPFNPETVKTVEIGAKIDTWGNRLRINAAIFDTRAKDLQRQLARATAQGIAEIVTQNAAAAKFQGAELELTAIPVPALTLNLSLGYLNARYTDYCAGLSGTAPPDPSLVPCAPAIVVKGGVIQPVNLTGLPIARTPRFTGRIGALYVLELGGHGSLGVSAELDHQGREMTVDSGAPVGTTLGIVNFDGSKVDPLRAATNIVNASITWKDPNEKYRLAIYGKNLSNEIYFRRLSFASPTLSFGTLANPREYGIDFTMNFGK